MAYVTKRKASIHLLTISSSFCLAMTNAVRLCRRLIEFTVSFFVGKSFPLDLLWYTSKMPSGSNTAMTSYDEDPAKGLVRVTVCEETRIREAMAVHLDGLRDTAGILFY